MSNFKTKKIKSSHGLPENIVDRNGSSVETEEINVTEKSKTFDDLPYECLYEIFKYLNIQEHLFSETVCEKWKDVSLRGWKHLEELDAIDNYYYFDGNIADESTVLETIVIRCGRFLSRLSITDKYSQRAVDAIAERCINITEFTINIYGENNNNLSMLLLNMTKLKKFTIRIYHPTNFNDDIFQSVNGTVEHFEISICANNGYIFSGNFAEMLQRFGNLQVLIMINSKVDTNFDNALPTFKNSLKRLDIPDAIFFYEDLRFEELTELEELQAPHIHQINNFCIQAYVTNLKNLKILNVGTCRSIDDIGFSLMPNFSKLTSLDVNGTDITDGALLNFVGLKCLEEFICSETKVTDVGIVIVLQHSPKLKYLNIEHTKVTRVTLDIASGLLETDKNNRVLEIVVDEQVASNVNLSRKIKILQY